MTPKRLALLAAFCTAIASAAPASARVQVNSSALQQLAGPQAAAKPAKRHRHGRQYARHPHTEARASHRTLPRRAHRLAARRLPLPPPPPPNAGVAGTGILGQAALRLPLPPAHVAPPGPPPPHLALDFQGRGTSLGEVERAAIERFLHKLPNSQGRFLIRATAPGKQGDPSLARRLSMQRGLEVQSVLVAAGIPPERIIVQSLGDPPGADTRRVVLSELP